MEINKNELDNIRKILVIKLRHIGDVLLTVPTLRALKEGFPAAKISVLLNSQTQDVLQSCPYVDELIVFNREIKQRSPLLRYLKEIKFLLSLRRKKFDLVVNLTGSDRAAIATLATGARYRLSHRSGKRWKRYIYTHMVPKDNKKHMVLQNIDVARQIGVNTEDLSIPFNVSKEELNVAERTFRKKGIQPTDFVVYVQPTARVKNKYWKEEYFARVIDHLLSCKFKVVLAAAPVEDEIKTIKKITSLCTKKPIEIIPDNIEQLAAFLKISDLFLGIDSAPMHIAASVGTPVAAIFGPTNEKIWGPWCNRKVIIAKEISCRAPCKRKKTCTDYKCLNALTPDEVIKKLDDFIHRLLDTMTVQ